MIRHTGGAAVGEISTRSIPASSAFCSASVMDTIPTCCPSAPIRRTLGTLIRPLTRCSLSSAMWQVLQNSNAVARNLTGESGAKRIERHAAQILALARAHGDGTLLRLPLAQHQQIRDTL